MERSQMTVANLPLNLKNLLFIGWVVCNRVLIRYSRNPHQFDPRYVSGDAFRSLADHIYEGQDDFDPGKIQTKDIVFVSLNVIDEYLKVIHPQIKHPYRLISHNGDTNITQAYEQYVDHKILVWWTQNCLISHPKVRPIPIGIENLSYFNHGIPSLFRQKKRLKLPNILYGFSISTNPNVRSKVHKILDRTSTAVPVPGRLNSREYIDMLSQYMFVASPPGNGEDCHRTWEATYVGVIPIVMRSAFMTHFEKKGLPVWVIDDWNELKKYSESDLHKKFIALTEKRNQRSLSFKYWQKAILTDREK